MPNRQLLLEGRTNKKGVFRIEGLMKMNAFFKEHPNCRVVARFDILSDNPKDRLIGYYYAKFIPFTVNIHRDNGDIINNEKADLFLRSLSNITHKKEMLKGKWISKILLLEDLDYTNLVLFMEDIRLKVAEKLGVNID